jgi:hypothetical protein
MDAPSKNEKTGAMLQLWIMRADVEPHVAVKTGEDASVCGDCKLRGTVCYVLTFQGPLAVYRKYKRGGYEKATKLQAAQAVEGWAVRLGAYGDPAALPLGLLMALTVGARSYTGYTHQWRSNPGYARYCMASVDTEAEYAEAVAMGWRTFRVRQAGAALMAGEIECPAAKGITCAACGLCKGTARAARNIGITAHGKGAKKFAPAS